MIYLIIIDDKKVAISSFTELKDVLEEYNSYNYIFLMNDIIITEDIFIEDFKEKVTIDGTYQNVRYTYEDMKNLIKRNHVIGCHTYTHHRMDEQDTEELLQHEIVDAKNDLEKALDHPVDVFCWCGGEENTYTKKAQVKIRENYDWGFMTNSELVTKETDHYFLERTNVEARWSVSLMKFQISGIVDDLYKKKRSHILNKLN